MTEAEACATTTGAIRPMTPLSVHTSAGAGSKNSAWKTGRRGSCKVRVGKAETELSRTYYTSYFPFLHYYCTVALKCERKAK